ncbi:MAG: class II fructose-bisphosphate aldolase [Clostridia bacterium]|nr:class II fructose-bisphosphate aldolase [Clostridia bacterium]
MLVTLKEILKIAEAKGTAIGSFNTPNMSSIRAVIGAAEELGEPVILMHAQVHEEMELCKMDEIAPVMLLLADKASVPVCVHLDHGTDLDYVKKGLDLGFTSVMYDGSTLDQKLNFANTSIARELSMRYGASLEAEIGSMGARESGAEGGESIYTDPDTAKDFVDKTGIDALACAFGTAHGVYLKQPKLDFERLAKINSLVDIPLVMHGGSGVGVEDYKKVISLGIRKINYYTYMAKAGGTAVSAMADRTFFHDIEIAAIDAMKRDVTEAIKVFADN